jgi:hypothetical protein
MGAVQIYDLLFFCLIILFLTSAPNIVAEEKVVKTAGL